MISGGGAGTITVTQLAGAKINALATGISTNSNSTGTTTINVNDKIRATGGAGSTGVKGVSTKGSIVVNVNGLGSIDPDVGVDLTTTDGALVVNNNGVILGDVTAVKLTATGTGTASVTNTKTITGGTAPVGNAILGSFAGGAVSITNTGTGVLNGVVNVTGSAASSVFTNNGTWNTYANTANTFTGNFQNAGFTNLASGVTVTVTNGTTNTLSGHLVTAANATLVTNLTNLGFIDASTSVAGNNAITVTGNYVGGGIINFDTNLATAVTDTLKVSGTGSGASTLVNLKILGQGLLPGGFLPVVTVAGGTSTTTAFTSNSLPATGLVIERFVQNPANATQYGVLQTLDPGTTQVAGLSTMANSISSLLDDPMSAYITERKGQAHQIGLWLRGGGGNFDQNLSTTFTSGAFSKSVSDRVRTRYYTVQGGLDYGILGLGEGNYNLHFGVTGGTYNGKEQGVASRTDFDASFLGGYIAVTGNGLTFDATVRKEWRHFHLFNSSIFATGKADSNGTATAGSVNLAYRVGFKDSGWAITPSAGYSWSSSSATSFTVDTLSTYTPGNDNGGTGRFGAKISWKSADTGKVVWEPYAGAYYLKNFSRTEAGTGTYGVSSLTSLTTAFDNGVQYTAGLSAHGADSRVTGYIQGSLYRSGGLGGATVSGGIRFNF